MGAHVKTAISIPDVLYESIEEFLEKTGMSRSEFFQRAARRYLDGAAARAITRNLDDVYAVAESPGDVVYRRAAASHFRDLDRDDTE
jgi:metal-responsive CopG/Arc/MetJ family transcriptional regulator